MFGLNTDTDWFCTKLGRICDSNKSFSIRKEIRQVNLINRTIWNKNGHSSRSSSIQKSTTKVTFSFLKNTLFIFLEIYIFRQTYRVAIKEWKK